MKITDALKGELIQWLETYWTTYIKGDYDRWATFVADDYYNIGGTKEEIWHCKQEILEYSYALYDQMVDQTEIRNREIEVLTYGDYLMVNDFTDLFVKIENEWAFYGPFRMSSLMSKTDTGWIALHQHGSYPDMKATEGEAFASDVLKAENKRLQEAVDQRTTELLVKNRELEIEAALEKVRSRTMAMRATSELQEVIYTVHQELLKLEIGIFGGSFIAINSEIDQELRCWGSGGTADTSDEVYIPYFDKPFYTNLVKGLKGGPAFFTEEFTQEEKKEFFTFLFTNEPWSALKTNEKKEILSSRGGYTRSCCVSQNTSIFIINHFGEKFSKEENEILRRFGKIFEQSYTRFLDLQKAESQTREAEIELSLERIRAQVTSMQSSNELLDIMVMMRGEFVKLGHEAYYFWHMRWLPKTYQKAMTSGDGSKIGMVMSLPRKIHGEIEKVAAWEKGAEPILVLDMDTETAVDYISKMVAWGDFEQVDHQAPSFDDIRHIQGLTFVMARTTHGEIGYSLPGKVSYPSKDAMDTLVRFAAVFDLAYRRFEDLLEAEANAMRAAEDLIKLKKSKAKAEKALKDLEAAQEQLVQQEKLASLGQLTAGIAHEIKNPLNFVNNFSDLSRELVEEVFAELENLEASATKEEIISILQDVQSNLTKVHEHGTRADTIVTSMLQHSRASVSKREPKAFNPLVKEFVNLSFHGMRAGKAPINVDIDLQLDSKVGDVNLISEDFSRVILNLCNNAFDAMRQKTLQGFKILGGLELYQLKLTVKTTLQKDKVLFSISDNGPGIPAEIRDKILQPFFTTKKGTEGTGWG
jgi:signal transduction histidine kinase